MRYEYECPRGCDNFQVFCYYSERNSQYCPKCNALGDKLLPRTLAIAGTRDNFGIGNIFKDEETGQEIDTWKKWEKAGYRDPVEVTKNHAVKEKIKEKIKKRKNS